MDYSDFTVEQLASDDSFIHWANRTDADSEKAWELFLSRHPDMKLKAEQARTLVLNLKKAEAMPQSEMQVEKMWRKIEDRIVRDDIRASKEKRSVWYYSYGVAAALSLAVLSVAAWRALVPQMSGETSSQPAGSVSASEYIEEVNTSGEELRLHLSDGSVVSLAHGSSLRCRRVFTDDDLREVYLTGEGFFEVAKDPTRPFLVHTDEVVTRVLGTSFRVKASEDNKEVVVTVRSGKVSVYALAPGEAEAESQKNGVILLPNQQVTYLRDQDSFGKALVAEPRIVLPTIRDSDFTFENTPIKEVFQILQKAYGVEIIFDEEVMNNCFITAPLGSEPLFEKLRIICRTIGAKYETIDARVVITSAGC